VHLATYVAAGGLRRLNRASRAVAGRRWGREQRLTIAANGGTLPASRSRARAGRVHLVPGEFLNSGVLQHPRFAFLGDVFAIPAGLPLANVFSIGDVLIVLGVGWGAHRICGSRLVPPCVATRPEPPA
jgi:hypothetical protein